MLIILIILIQRMPKDTFLEFGMTLEYYRLLIIVRKFSYRKQRSINISL